MWFGWDDSRPFLSMLCVVSIIDRGSKGSVAQKGLPI